MTAKVLELENVLEQDRLACEIARTWTEWDSARQVWKNSVEEIIRYLYATDTTHTTNAQLPWKNKTTVPKATQIMDNLYANYTATLFPQRKWMIWEANEKDSDQVFKRDSIVNYMSWAVSQPSFKQNVYKALHDYIQTGNTLLMPEWVDERVQIDEEGRTQAGYVGPAARRINPLDLVMNPVAEEFQRSPKIIRSVLSLGEVKDMLDSMTTDENREELMKLWDYMKNIRGQATNYEGEWSQNDAIYQIAGFSSYRDYLRSNYVEILTFYGDMYDNESDSFFKNHIIIVVDRHKVIAKKPNPSYFGYPPIFHAAWRKRSNNLWGMGPLDNLIGMQYRMDHLENMKADIMDLVTYPVMKVKGFVEEFDWRPAEKIFVGEEGDVEIVAPDVNALQANLEIQNLERLMEEMSGSPKEAMGFRTPGEKTKYEVQRLENAASRLFQSKIRQFEEEVLEPLLNAMLELARRNMVGATTIKVFDDEFKVASFQTLTVEDITGVGRIKPVAASHFTEQAELIQNLTNLTNSGLWPTVQPHFSSIRLAQIVEDAFNLSKYEAVLPFVALSEQADAQKHSQSLEENVAMQTMTASGMGEDFDLDQLPPELG